MKKHLSTLAVLLLLCVAAFGQTPKYVFYFMGDGMGLNQVNTTQLYNQAMGQPDLNFYYFPVRNFVTSYSASALVTDSAAAGTALSTGVKTYNGALGVDMDHKPLKNIAEKAKDAGKGVGVVTSVSFNHASPGAFVAHVKSREDFEDINPQLIDECKADFVAGASFLYDRKVEGHDYKYWLQRAEDSGIRVMKGKEEYVSVPKGQRVIMTSNTPEHSALAYAIDRKGGETRLADFVECAIDNLYSNYSRQGFFMFVEGGKIDYACHARDAATTIAEVNDMASAIDVALEFYRKHPKETVIIVTADHETGAFCMANGKYALYPEVLANQNCSLDALTAAIKQLRKESDIVEWTALKGVLTSHLGLWDSVPVTPEQSRVFTQMYKEGFLDKDGKSEKNLYSSNEPIAQEAIRYLDSVAMFTWGTRSHSGAHVPLFAIGAKSEEFAACRDNTDIPKTIEKIAKY